ncbi:MAG: hypothetical protein ACFFCM_13380 [Promethearchaeota archaeon]
MFRKILNFVKNKKVVNLEEIAKFLEKDITIISDAVNLLSIKGYLLNLNCCESDQNLKNKCILCSQKSICHSNFKNRYEITPKGIQYSVEGAE